jgi:hypothetical protein
VPNIEFNGNTSSRSSVDTRGQMERGESRQADIHTYIHTRTYIYTHTHTYRETDRWTEIMKLISPYSDYTKASKTTH